MTREELLGLYTAANCAEDAWSDELRRVYGERFASAARYDHRGKATTDLRVLSVRRDRAVEAWITALRQANQESRP